ncbi:MAG: bifunctional folylpolyglutamate synthase/dihydrofolate synthase [Alphaproteobacteria bacterium]|nr:bifunctional folylpolyglutamate synthase/dihydrofolate synthase [Alphaproteobacteria bacterium]
MMRAEAALERLSALHPKLIDLGLDRGLNLLAKLGNPHHHLPPVIHIAGTNGKGSSLAVLRAVFEAAGKSVHAYTSPHLVRFHERIRIGGHLITDTALADLLEEVEAINGDDPMTFFEITTAAALLAFQRNPADVVLLETGLGGRADSTNVVAAPHATIITPIARDHEHFLGDTLTAIAGEKAGIMRRGVPCFSARQAPEAEAALIAHAEALGAPLMLIGRDIDVTPIQNGVRVSVGPRSIELTNFGLKGAHQHDNAALVTAALMHSFPELDDEAIIAGVAAAAWPGRIQHLDDGALAAQCPDEVNLWLDGAHNAHGADALAATLEGISDRPWVLVFGALNTRPPKDFLTPLMPLIDQAIAITIPHQEAALTSAELVDHARQLDLTAHAASDLPTAMEHAITAAERVGGHFIIAGSLFLAGHVLDFNRTLPQ